jgi:hypothetical protein
MNMHKQLLYRRVRLFVDDVLGVGLHFCKVRVRCDRVSSFSQTIIPTYIMLGVLLISGKSKCYKHMAVLINKK